MGGRGKGLPISSVASITSCRSDVGGARITGWLPVESVRQQRALAAQHLRDRRQVELRRTRQDKTLIYEVVEVLEALEIHNTRV